MSTRGRALWFVRGLSNGEPFVSVFEREPDIANVHSWSWGDDWAGELTALGYDEFSRVTGIHLEHGQGVKVRLVPEGDVWQFSVEDDV